MRQVKNPIAPALVGFLGALIAVVVVGLLFGFGWHLLLAAFGGAASGIWTLCILISRNNPG